MWARIWTMAIFTGRVNVITKAVVGAALVPTIFVAVILPEVCAPESNSAWICFVRPNPS